MKVEELSRDMFSKARSYSMACYTLNRAVVSHQSLFLPSCVLAAFALELYFKTLYLITKKQEPKYSHNFHNLFKQLEQQEKDKLNNSFKSIMSAESKKESIIHYQKTQEVVRKDNPNIVAPTYDVLEEQLEAWSPVFAEVRYPISGSKNTNGYHMFFFQEIEEAVLSLIYELKPDWKI